MTLLLSAGLLWVKPAALPKARSSGDTGSAPIIDDSDIPILPEIEVCNVPAVVCQL